MHIVALILVLCIALVRLAIKWLGRKKDTEQEFKGRYREDDEQESRTRYPRRQKPAWR